MAMGPGRRFPSSLCRCALPVATVFGLVSAWAAPPADALADSICKPGPRWDAPQPRQLKGCDQAVCTVSGEHRLCACKTRNGWQYQHRTGDQVVQQWSTEVSPMTGAGEFDVQPVGIAADGRSSWLVVRLLGVGNGLGVSTHELCVVDLAKSPTLPTAAPMCRMVSEWRSLTVLVQEPGRTGCSLMDSNWQSGREPGRGPGTYATGRLWRWQDARWQAVPTDQRQAVARRLLPDFMAHRQELPQTQNAAGTLWYQHAGAQTTPCPGPLCPALARSIATESAPAR